MNKLGQAAGDNWPAIAWTVGPSSAVAGLAMHAAGQYGDVVALGALGTAGTAGVLALASLSKKWSETFSWASGALSLAALHAGVSALSGWDWPTLYSWVISSGLSFAAYLAYRHHTRNDIHHLDKRIKLSKAETAFARARMAELQLADKLTAPTAVVAPEPSTVLTGTVLESPEERALREAFHAVWKSPLESVRAQRTGYGYEAVLVVPATPGRDRVLREWSKIEGGVSVEGEFYPTKGTLSNEVLVRYVEGNPLAESIEYEPTPGRTHKDPIRLGGGMFGDALEVDMNQNHTLVAGTSKYGKSNIMKLIAFRLAEAGAVLYGVDMKPNAIEFTPLKPILQDLAQTPSQARALFVWLTKEMHERGAIINDSDIKEWDPAVHGRPAIYVLIDEHKILISLGDAEAKQTGEVKISKLVEDLLALARGFGIHLVIAAQQPDKDVFPERGCGASLCHPRATPSETREGSAGDMFPQGGPSPRTRSLPRPHRADLDHSAGCVTNVPLPCTARASPRSRSSRIARRTVIRATPHMFDRSSSLGRREPTGRSPRATCPAMKSAMTM